MAARLATPRQCNGPRQQGSRSALRCRAPCEITPAVRWATAISTNGLVIDAVNETAAAVEAQLGSLPPHLVLFFVSDALAQMADDLPELVQRRFPGATVIGTSGGGVIGGGREEEEVPAFALTAAHLPDVHLAPFHIDTAQLPAETAPAASWHTTLGVPPDAAPNFLLFADPYTCDVNALLRGLDRAYPRSKKAGGVAVGGKGAGATRLYLHGMTWRSGAVGVALRGRIRMDTLVAQGSRPIGTPMLVTRADGTVLIELNQKRPLEVIKALYDELGEKDQELFRNALFLGVEMKGGKVEVEPGDFLARNIVGVDPRTGTIAVGTDLEPYQVVQFMVRDAKTAREDLTAVLERYRAQRQDTAPAGALLFTCIGRGRELYGEPNHDSARFRDIVGDVPLGGFFCNGEIGPVGGTTFQHGYTSAFALFSDP